ncbi:DUF2706 domain-containing protein [Rickettsia prowazekii]|uniref:Uncharacterized protein RP288 n=2 Tax=Rickettsia prowazekii TaxID=782 RepID=Y288_RICPR|nr:DUF2706 domain-containing protein [Rickettsia prowazekii]Q9ZDN9.1 RecName: Full=Uncharacterized protein RP288 [Rickettsia prowazekii str. Madrid E]ADE29800.1 hypothetical protein rpr22_CDS282 [Rickettsia prowazekii str. Rp22]AFE49105.1 hypothetical protein M9W_01400 [Rickettsia prowazekii str. Chernikova]AFE49951.1 hypothetical protein M9Y_01405 [Rickettsia prowazekii str. Katsinyian]AFE50795.1 hypothetical protein MA1_01395 [Rickettsia prowazekii str. BuV67-CWPP]AFE51634.1 hypothetical pr
MLKSLKFLLVFIILAQLLSCTPSAPYEIKSPCVSVDIDDNSSLSINPCIRRPINAVNIV